MSSGEDFPGKGDGTVIQPQPGGADRPFSGWSPRVAPDPTLFFPQGSRPPGEGAAEATVVAAAAAPEAAAVAPGAADSRFPPDSPRDASSLLLAARAYPSANPLLAAAAPALMLLGYVQQGEFRADAALASRFAEAVRDFERRVAGAGTAAETARIAKYALCETVDDIAGNAAAPDEKAVWQQDGMLARFFSLRAAGSGFFEALNKILADPAAQPDLLELMHACLRLGFEGQYRGAPAGRVRLTRVEADVYAALRHVRPVPAGREPPRRSETLPAGRLPPARRVPIWAAAGGAMVVLAAAYLVASVLLGRDAEALAGRLLALNPPGTVAIRHAAVAPPPKQEAAAVAPPIGQAERLRSALASDISAGGLVVAERNTDVVVTIDNALVFDPGRAAVKASFLPLAAHIAGALEAEKEPVRVVGYTDNVKPRRPGPFKSNVELSLARAKNLAAAIAAKLPGSPRLVAEGLGEQAPVADNGTPEGRARNRRTELVMPHEASP